MAVVIRLKRTGAKKDVSFRIVVADSRRARDGRFIEQLGFYDPEPRESQYRVDVERAQYWLGVGAQASEQVKSLLRRAGVALPAPARKPKTESAKAAGKTKGRTAAKKQASAREGARRLRKRSDRVQRRKVAGKKAAKGKAAAAAPAAS